MRSAVETGSAGGRSPASGSVFVATNDTPKLLIDPTEIQTRSLSAYFGLSPATAAAIAALAWPAVDHWSGRT